MSYGRPKLTYFDGTKTRTIRISSMSRAFRERLAKHPFVSVEGSMDMQRIPDRVYHAILEKENPNLGITLPK